MKIELLTMAAISGLCAFSQAATILTDFSTTGDVAFSTNVGIQAGGGQVQVTGGDDLLTYKAGSLVADADDIRPKGLSGTTPIASTIALDNQNSGADIFGDTLSVTYQVGGNGATISAITMKSGFFNGGNGNFQSNPAAASYTLDFIVNGNVLATWTGVQRYVANATETNTMELSGQAFDLAANSEVTMRISIEKAATTAEGRTNNGGFFGVDSISMEANAIPEPATASLGLLGLGALMLRRRRK